MATFRVSRLRGYERRPVDDLVRRIEGTLGLTPLTGPPVDSREVRAQRFRVVVRGYNRRIVDAVLLERLWELEAIERGPRFTGARPTVVESAARPGLPRPASAGSADPGPGAADPGERGSGVVPGADRLAGWIRDAEFGRSWTRSGYSARDVDDFLDRVVAGLLGRAAPVGGRDVRESAFRVARVAPGYDQRQVDRFLTWLATSLDGLDRR